MFVQTNQLMYSSTFDFTGFRRAQSKSCIVTRLRQVAHIYICPTKPTCNNIAALPEWLRGMPAKCMRKRAKVRTLQAAILLCGIINKGLCGNVLAYVCVSFSAAVLNCSKASCQLTINCNSCSALAAHARNVGLDRLSQ